MGNETSELKVYMLGRFAVTCGEQAVSFKQNPGTKAMKLFQLLLHATYAEKYPGGGIKESPAPGFWRIFSEEKSFPMRPIT